MGIPQEIPEGEEARYFEIFESIVKESHDPDSGSTWGVILGNMYDLLEDPLGNEFVAVVRAENRDKGTTNAEMSQQAQSLAVIAHTIGSIAEDLMAIGTARLSERIENIEDEGPSELERYLGIGDNPRLTRAQLKTILPLVSGYLKASIPALTFAVGSVHFEALHKLKTEREMATFEAEASAELEALFGNHGTVEE